MDQPELLISSAAEPVFSCSYFDLWDLKTFFRNLLSQKL